jgi:hypothetical protein
MTRQVQMRVVLTVDDAVTLEEVARDLRTRLRAMPADVVPGGAEGDATERTVFWPATDVLRMQGAETKARPSRPPARPAMRLEDVK